MAAVAHLAGLTSYTGQPARSSLDSLLRFVETSASYKIEEANNGIDIVLSECLSLSMPESAAEAPLAAGSAIYMLRLAMRCHGMRPRVAFKLGCSKGDVLARVSTAGPVKPSEEDLALLFGGSGLPSSPGPQMLSDAVTREGARLRLASQTSLAGMEIAPIGELAGVICTGFDDITGWLVAGQAIRHAQLLVEARGGAIAVRSGSECNTEFRARFARESGFRDFPHAIISCTGYPTAG